MKQVKIGELYQELVLGLDELIKNTVGVQEANPINSDDYQEALKFQIELEKAKLNIIKTVGEKFLQKITDKVLVELNEGGTYVYGVEDSVDARLSENTDNIKSVPETNNLHLTVNIDNLNSDKNDANKVADQILKSLKQIGR